MLGWEAMTTENQGGLYVQECYRDGSVHFEEAFFDRGEAEVRAIAQRLAKSPMFEADFVRVITGDGELVGRYAR